MPHQCVFFKELIHWVWQFTVYLKLQSGKPPDRETTISYVDMARLEGISTKHSIRFKRGNAIVWQIYGLEKWPYWYRNYKGVVQSVHRRWWIGNNFESQMDICHISIENNQRPGQRMDIREMERWNWWRTHLSKNEVGGRIMMEMCKVDP